MVSILYLIIKFFEKEVISVVK